jgi:hypothetical protein
MCSGQAVENECYVMLQGCIGSTKVNNMDSAILIQQYLHHQTLRFPVSRLKPENYLTQR